MSQTLRTSLLLSVAATAATLSILGVWLWKQKKGKKSYKKVGKVIKLLFFPVKSLKATIVTNGKCTKRGFEVNGLLDRSYMVISGDNVLLSQRQAPRLVLLTPQISDNYLIISGPGVEDLKVEIRNSITPSDKLVECKLFTDSIKAVDCGDEAAVWFQKFLDLPDLRLVHYNTELPDRKYLRNDPFYKNVKKEYPVGFQDLAAFHLLSKPSLDDLNSKLEEKISEFNFRPNIVVDGCQAFDEDSWKYIKFSSGAEMVNILPCSRCIETTNHPDTAVLTKKEPLVTLRKYRIPKDPKIAKIVSHIPCFGVHCSLLKEGEICIGDEISAAVGNWL